MTEGKHNGRATRPREPGEPRPVWHDWPLWAGALLLAAVVGGGVLAFEEPIRAFFSSRQQVVAVVRGAGAWGPLVIFGLELAQSLIAPIPGGAIELASGYLFGAVWGTLYCASGVFTGMALNLALSRRFGRPLAERLIPRPQLERLDDLAQRRGAVVFFLIFLMPFLPDDAAALVAGLSPLPLPYLFALGVVGRLPGLAVGNLLGSRSHLLGPEGWAVAAAGLLLIAAFLWRYGERLEGALFRWFERLRGGESRLTPMDE